MVIAEGRLAILTGTMRAEPATTVVTDRLRPAQNKTNPFEGETPHALNTGTRPGFPVAPYYQGTHTCGHTYACARIHTQLSQARVFALWVPSLFHIFVC